MEKQIVNFQYCFLKIYKIIVSICITVFSFNELLEQRAQRSNLTKTCSFPLSSNDLSIPFINAVNPFNFWIGSTISYPKFFFCHVNKMTVDNPANGVVVSSNCRLLIVPRLFYCGFIPPFDEIKLLIHEIKQCRLKGYERVHPYRSAPTNKRCLSPNKLLLLDFLRTNCGKGCEIGTCQEHIHSFDKLNALPR